MSIPEQVRRAAERANELLSNANGEPNPADAPAPAPEPVIQQPTDQVESNPAPVAAPVASTPSPASAPAPAETDWEHKFKTVQGILVAEQTKWRTERQDLTARITALEAAPKPQPAPASAPAPASKVTDKDLETYGPDLIDVIGRKAAEIADGIVAQRMAEFQPKLDQTVAQVADVQTKVYQSQEERFHGELSKEVPDWQAINQDERWFNWLAEVDPMSRVPRQVYLNHAAGNMDHVHAAQLFKAFKDSIGMGVASTAAPAPAPAPAPAQPAISPSPRPVGTASAPSIREPQAGVKRSEISAHYGRSARDVAYRNSAEHKAMEARIANAMATNSVIEA